MWSRRCLVLGTLMTMLAQATLMPRAFAANPGCSQSTAPAGYSVALCITSPSPGAVLSGDQNVTATLAVSGTNPGVNSLTYFLDGNYLVGDNQAPYVFDLTTNQFANGAHTLSVEADFSGGYASSRASISLSFSNSPAPPPGTNFKPSTGTTPAPGQPLVVAAAGDGATGLTASAQVNQLIASWNPNLFLYLGDVYNEGSAEDFTNWYGHNGSYFSQFKSITNPTLGNEEYSLKTGAAAYFNYWAGVPHYYSYNVAGWHFITLDNTLEFNQTTTGSAQYQWLVKDLAANNAACTLVTYHRPVYSLEKVMAAPDFSAYWQLLAANHVTLVLNGHAHSYQRWTRLDGAGNPNPNGILQIVAGTGGQWISPFDTTDSRAVSGFDTTATAWGAVQLKLNPSGANFQFTNAVTGAVEDSGTAACGSAPDQVAPTVPQGLKASSPSGREADLSWTQSTDNVGVSGYTIYRNGAAIATLPGYAQSYADVTVAGSTSYSYSVDAFDAAGNHSAQSSVAPVTTPSPAPTFVQAGTVSTGGRATSTTIALSGAVGKGDLLVGWFSQYDAAGPVQVTDNVDGSWTRASGETFSSGSGDISLYCKLVSAAAPNGVTVTVSASSATYLQGSAAEYYGVAASPPEAITMAKGSGTTASSGSTPSVGAGQLVFGGLVTGGSPGYTPGSAVPQSTQGVPLVLRSATSSNNAVAADATSTAPGSQAASFGLATATDWYAAAAVFWPASPGDTTPPSVPANVLATAANAHQAKVTWSGSTDNVAVTGYTVYRNGTAVGTVPASTLSYTDTGLASSTTYSYTADAFDAAGNHSAPSPAAVVTTPAQAFVQAGSASTGGRATSTTITLPGAVGQGDVVAGWFSQYDAVGQVQVSDNVTGTWTRVGGETFANGTGDIALYYTRASTAAANGLTITVSAGSATYIQGTAAEYSGLAAMPPEAVALAKGSGTSASSGVTASVGPGQLVFAGLITGGSPGAVTPGSTQGIPLTLRSTTGSNNALIADATLSAAGGQAASFGLVTSTDWYAVAAAFWPASPADKTPPSVPANVQGTAVNAHQANVSWSASTDNVGVAGYTVYRNGTVLGTATAGTLSYTDATLAPSMTYTYTVDAFDSAGNHSAQSSSVSVTTPSPALTFVQGGSASTGGRLTSTTIALPGAVAQGDLLVGWFSQYDAAGQVQGSDNINGTWTRVGGETFGNGAGDNALYYTRALAAAPNGLTITLSAGSATYLAGSVADYTGLAATASLDQSALSRGVGTSASSGPTGATAAGELVIGALITGGSPGSVTPGTTGGVPLVIRTSNGSNSTLEGDILVSNAARQSASFTLRSATDWYAACMVFRAS